MLTSKLMRCSALGVLFSVTASIQSNGAEDFTSKLLLMRDEPTEEEKPKDPHKKEIDPKITLEDPACGGGPSMESKDFKVCLKDLVDVDPKDPLFKLDLLLLSPRELEITIELTECETKPSPYPALPPLQTCKVKVTIGSSFIYDRTCTLTTHEGSQSVSIVCYAKKRDGTIISSSRVGFIYYFSHDGNRLCYGFSHGPGRPRGPEDKDIMPCIAIDELPEYLRNLLPSLPGYPEWKKGIQPDVQDRDVKDLPQIEQQE